MSRRRLIFHCGFGFSLILLIAVIASGAEDFGRQSSDFRYAEMPHVATWAALLYMALNLPVVIAGALLAALIGRTFSLPVLVTAILWPAICVYLSYYWWDWLSRRLTARPPP